MLFCITQWFLPDWRLFLTLNKLKLLKHLDIDHPYFEGTVNRIYPPELQLNKANTSDTEAPFWICI